MTLINSEICVTFNSFLISARLLINSLKEITMFKNLKKWKTIVQFVITVLTAIVSSFLTQSCKS